MDEPRNDDTEYDRLADVYDHWAESDAEAWPTRRFYTSLCAAEPGPVVELGVGTGRIAIEVARLGKSLVGIDVAPRMLEVCRRKAEEEGLLDRLHLVQADARAFDLDAPAALITFPFRGIAHCLTLDDLRALLASVHRNLAPGGRFVFDHDVIHAERARARDGVPQLRRVVPLDDGRRLLLWNVFHFSIQAQQMRGFVIVETLGPNGEMVSRGYRPLTARWLPPETVPGLLERAGFEVQAAYGDFDRGPLTTSSLHQVWLARKPAQ